MLNVLPNFQARTTPSPTVEGDKKKNVRGTSFLTAQGVAFAKSWLNVSENPIAGSERKENDFYRALTGFNNDKYKTANLEVRTMESVRKRVLKLNKQCVCLDACVVRVARKKPAETNWEEIMMMGTAIYNDVDFTAIDEDPWMALPFLDFWNTLRHHPEFGADLDPVMRC
ncbi:unnamed protein product [Agarophyton chilense]